MPTQDEYVRRVIDRIPQALSLREQVALDLRSHFAERTERGSSVEEAIRQLGDPDALARSYLSALPLVRPPFGRRVLAKAIDFALCLLLAGPLVWTALRAWQPFLFAPDSDMPPAMVFLAVGIWSLALSGLILTVYTAALEYWLNCTLGKWAMGLLVVREDGSRIGLGQSIVRQLSVAGQVFLIDGLFALFTEKRQRAFELASKTRVVRLDAAPVGAAHEQV
jgi:uncharacterized RDD family membrane protein YckC